MLYVSGWMFYVLLFVSKFCRVQNEIMTLLLHLKICWVDVHSTENISSSLKNQS